MKTASTALAALLNTAEIFRPADLYTFNLVNGTILNFTSHDVNITIGSVTYTPMLLKRGNIKSMRGIETTSTLGIELMAGSEDLIYASVPILHTLRRGDFDGAILHLDRVYNPNEWEYNNPPISVDYVMSDLFVGRVDVPEVLRQSAQLDAKSFSDVLNVTPMPGNVLIPSCLNTLYDSVCTVVKATYTTVGSCFGGSSISLISANLAALAGYYDLGVIAFTSGANIGLRRTIKSYVPGVIRLVAPLNYVPAVGDAFTIYPGCDKMATTCTDKFNNISNFKGYPYVPNTEALM